MAHHGPRESARSRPPCRGSTNSAWRHGSRGPERALDADPLAGELAESQAPRVLLYTDLVGSTSINVRIGDRRFLALVSEHQAIVDRCTRSHRGMRFHNTGDGFGIWFTDVDDALDCAAAIHRDFDKATQRHPDAPLAARMGVAAGRPIPFDGDLYGTAVVRAARVCQAADSGEVLVAAEVMELNPRGGHRIEPAGERELKGFSNTTATYRLLHRTT